MDYSKKLIPFFLVWTIVSFSLFYNKASGSVITETHTSFDQYHIFHANVAGADSIITVEGNGKVISDGDGKPEEQDATEFGSHDIDTGRVTRTYWIFYESTNMASYLEITTDITSSDAAFTISRQPAKRKIDAGDSISFEITFDPFAIDTTLSTITIPNSISEEKAYTFAVKGTATGIIEINVKGNEQDIVNNDVTPSKADHTDFGEADVTTETVTRTFWIYNEGNTDLAIGTIAIGPVMNDPTVFSVTQPAVDIIPRDDSISFEITFDPHVSDTIIAAIIIPNNDNSVSDSENPYYYHIQAIGTDNGQIEVKGNHQLIADGDSIPSMADHTSFGRINVDGDSLSRTYWMHNLGTADLHITDSIRIDNPLFTITQPDFPGLNFPLTILPGDSISFTVTFDPVTKEEATAIITIPSDDTEESPYTFTVAGSGSGLVEIVVRGNDQVIINRDTVPSLADGTDLGSTFANMDSISSNFWIINAGNDTLNITDIINSSDRLFLVTPPANTIILAGDSVSFTVTFVPDTLGTFTSVISIPNDDVDKDPYIFTVSATSISYFDGVPVAVDDDYTIEANTQLNDHVLTGSGIDTLSHDGGNTVDLINDVSSGILTLNSDGSFTYIPDENFWGDDHFIYQLCDADDDCTQATVTIHVTGSGINLYNAFSPDDDGVNDVWEIDNIENYPSSKVVIFNRWGNKVWEGQGYDNRTMVWRGNSNTGLRVGSALPDGTYFYIITTDESAPQQGYVVISRKR